MRRLWFLFLLCNLSLVAGVSAQEHASEKRRLTPGQLIEHEISGGQAQSFLVMLNPGQFLRAVVTSHGLEVAATLYGPDGQKLLTVDLLKYPGPEPISFAVEKAGEYRLEIQSGAAPVVRGRYELVTEVKPLAQETDRQRLAAERLLIEANDLEREGSPESLQKSIDERSEALVLWRQLGDKYWEAYSLHYSGRSSEKLNKHQEALTFYDQALLIRKEIGDRQGEAASLNNSGIIYADLGQTAKARDLYDEALNVSKAIGDTPGQARVALNFAIMYEGLGEKRKAVESYEQVLTYRREVGDKDGETMPLDRLGTIYAELGEKQKALALYGELLQLERASNDKGSEAATLNNIGNVYSAAGETRRALEFFNQALPVRRAVGDQIGEAATLHGIGMAYSNLGEPQKALEFYQQALSIERAVGDKISEAGTLSNLGNVYGSLGATQKALESFHQALALAPAVNDVALETRTFNNLMALLRFMRKPALAIFYGKQAVNNFQKLRASIHGLDNGTQRTYLKAIERAYKNLADTLIVEDRLYEATEAINLLRDEESFDFDRDSNRPTRNIVLTPHEKAASADLQAALKEIATGGQLLATLKRNLGKHQPPLNEIEERKRLEDRLGRATDDFLTTVSRIEADFSGPVGARDRVNGLTHSSEMNETLRELSSSTRERSAVLYSLVRDVKIQLVLILPDGELRGFETPIEVEELNQKILQFYALLQSPAYDPRPLGKQLYDIIFKPVEAELKRTGVQTLMWQLDGNLRYLPMAALFDGDKYLVERFQNVVFTRADKERMTRAVSPNWIGTGFGSSQAHTVDLLGDGDKIKFDALPGVSAELASIFRRSKANATIKQASSGILEGDVFTDAQFTKDAFYEAVKLHRPVVHISSHFSFRPGDDSRSFLLLGDGTALTLNELKKQTRLFEGVELLTLSACNTALQQANADGREIDGFAELTQRLGAGSVLATLWPVADNSTPWLMREFYQTRERSAGLTKANALRQAQLALLAGKAQTQPLPEGQKGASLLKVVITGSGERDGVDTRSPTLVRVDKKVAPPYRRDKQKPFAHPYYWAPFILIGNWR